MSGGQSRRQLRSLISTLTSSASGCEAIGPQCTFLSEVTENSSIIVTKSVAEILEIKFGTRNSFAPALGDFLSSHQTFFGTVRPCVRVFVIVCSNECILDHAQRLIYDSLCFALYQ